VILKCPPGSWPGSQLDSHNENQLIFSQVRMGVRINLRFSHEWEPIMRISSIIYIYIYIYNFYFILFWENWTGSLIYFTFSFKVPVPVGAAAFHFYIFYAVLLATSYSVFIFQFSYLASIVSIPRKILHWLAVSFLELSNCDKSSFKTENFIPKWWNPFKASLNMVNLFLQKTNILWLLFSGGVAVFLTLLLHFLLGVLINY
jgi:hypothetical protein